MANPKNVLRRRKLRRAPHPVRRPGKAAKAAPSGGADRPLGDEAIIAALVELPGWTRKDNHLEKSFKFPDFRHAFAFMVRAAFESEALNHHPDWTNCYSELSIRLTTHDAGDRITAKDVELARRIERVWQQRRNQRSSGSR